MNIRKITIFFFALTLVGSFFWGQETVVRAAGPSVTFLINGGTAPVMGGPLTVTLSWSTTGASECFATGTDSTNWVSGATNIPLNGSGTYNRSSIGTTYYVITCQNLSGEFTTLTREVIAGYAGMGFADCDVNPEVTGLNVSISVENLTSGGTSSASANPNETNSGADLGVSMGDELLVQYSVGGTFGTENQITLSSTGGSYHFGTSTAVNIDDSTSGTFLVKSVNTIPGSISISAGACPSNGGGGGSASIPLVSAPPSFNISCSPLTTTINVGSSASFNLSTTAQNGFSGPVTFSHSISPSSGTLPTITYVNNSQSPPAVTGANVSTTLSTTPATYSIVFTATSGVITKQCTVQLIVNGFVPSVDIKANGADGPITVPYYSDVTISWSSGNVDSCTVTPGGWTGLVGSQSSGPMLADTTYTATCTGPYGQSTDSVQVTIITPQPPTVDIKANGSDGPITIPYNSSATISWSSTDANDCNVTSSPSGFFASGVSNAGISSGVLTSSYVFFISCTGPEGWAGDNVTVNVQAPTFTISCSPATVTMEVGSSTSYTITIIGENGFNSQVNFTSRTYGPPLSRGQTNPSVSFSPNPSLPGTVTALVTTNAVTTPPGSYDFTLIGTASGFPVQDCDVELILTATTPPGQPTAVSASNAQCDTIDISWRNSLGTPIPSAYRVYRRASLTDPWQQLGSDIPYVAGGPLYTYTVTDSTPLNSNGSNYYSVSAVASGVESGISGATPSPIVPVPCAPNILSSDKDVVSVTGKINKNFAPVVCSGTSEPATLPNGSLFTVGDVITFRISVCNTGTQALSNVHVTDTYTNLSGFVVLPGSIRPPCVTGSTVGPSSVTIDMTDIPPSGGVCSVDLTAIVTAPALPSSSIYRFQNRALISGDGGVSYEVYTPPYLFSVAGGVPDRTESAP